MQEGLNSDASYGDCQGSGGFGGLKRTGRAAKGIPRNFLMTVLEDGSLVVIPTSTPESIVAVGRKSSLYGAEFTAIAWKARRSDIIIVMIKSQLRNKLMGKCTEMLNFWEKRILFLKKTYVQTFEIDLKYLNNNAAQG